MGNADSNMNVDLVRDDIEGEVEELMLSLVEDIFEVIKIIGEENSTKAYNIVLETKAEALRTVKAMMGGIVLSPANYLRIVKLSAKITKISAKFVKANVNMLM